MGDKGKNNVSKLVAQLDKRDESALKALEDLKSSSEHSSDISSALKNQNIIKALTKFFHSDKASPAHKKRILIILNYVIYWEYYDLFKDIATVEVFLQSLQVEDAELIKEAAEGLTTLINESATVNEEGTDDEEDEEEEDNEEEEEEDDGPEVLDKLLESGGIEFLIDVLKRKDPKLGLVALAALCDFTSYWGGLRTFVYSKSVLPILIDIMNTNPIDSELVLKASELIGNLVIVEAHREVMLSNGVFELHINMLFSDEPSVYKAAGWFFENILEMYAPATDKFLAHEGAVARLLALLSENIEKTLLGCLCFLTCTDDAKTTLPLSQIEALLSPLLKLETDVSSKKKKKKADDDEEEGDASELSTIAAITLANITDSDKLGGLTIDEDLVRYLDENMVNTISGESCYWCLAIFVRGIANLAVSDNNKVIIGNTNIIATLVNILKLKEDDDLELQVSKNFGEVQEYAAQALWNLAFNEHNKTTIKNNPDAIKTLKLLSTSRKASPALRKNAKGALFMVEVKEQAPKPVVQAAVAAVPSSPSSAGARKPQVMLSYCWAQQPMVKRIAADLKNHGIRVWLDIEQMAGSTLEAMASAVETSDVIVICMSKKYKDSPNCRLEGEYTSNLRKPTVLLMMEKDYRPDGWLGIMLGAKLWYNFTDDSKFEGSMEQIKKQLDALLNVVTASAAPASPSPAHAKASAAPAVSPTTAAAPASPAVTAKPTLAAVAKAVAKVAPKPAVAIATPARVLPAPVVAAAEPQSRKASAEVLKWKTADVTAWLKKSGLDACVASFEKENVDGTALSQLSFLSVNNEKTFSKILEKIFGAESSLRASDQLRLMYHLRVSLP